MKFYFEDETVNLHAGRGGDDNGNYNYGFVSSDGTVWRNGSSIGADNSHHGNAPSDQRSDNSIPTCAAIGFEKAYAN